MSRFEAWFQHLASLLVAGTGVLYAWMLYALEPADEFSLWNHPWQGAVRDAHLLTAPLLVLGFGVAWALHAAPRLRRGEERGRRSGLTLALCFLPMTLSGYLLQVSVGEGWRLAWLAVHLASSTLWIAGYALHQARTWRLPRRRRQRSAT